tara:strand:- start:6348 stop:8933 length:2586 start_codon:yes stop_codon:yes gene_type:complete
MDTNLRLISAVVGARVTSRVAALSGAPGAFAIQIAPLGHPQENKIAVWDGATGAEQWVYLAPQVGWHFYVSDELINVQWTGAAWVEFAGAGGGGGGAATSGSQIVLQVDQSVGQLVDTTTATLAFGNIVEDSESIWNSLDNTIRVPVAAVGRTAVIVAQTKHSADGAGALETVLEKSVDSGTTWTPIATSGTSEDYFGFTTVSAVVVFAGSEWLRVRHTTVAAKTTSGDNQTALTLTTIGDGQVGRIVRRATTIPILNPQFNAGDFTSYITTLDTGGPLKIYIPPDKETDHALHPNGYNYMGMLSDLGGPWTVEQQVSVPSGMDEITFTWDQHTRLIDDMIRFECTFLGVGDAAIGTYIGDPRINSAIALWETFSDTAVGIPTGTVAVILKLRTVVTAGSQQLNVTNFRASAGLLGVSGMIPGSVYAYLPPMAGNPNKILQTNTASDDIIWGNVPLRIQAGAVDKADPEGIEFIGSDFTAALVGDTVQITFQGRVAVDGAGGAVTGGLTKLTFTGAGVGLSSPVAGEIDITIPGPGEAFPAATSIEEIDGFNVVRSNLGAQERGLPLVWDGPANAFVPLPADLWSMNYGGGSQVILDTDLVGLGDLTLTELDHNLSAFDEIHFFLNLTNQRADIFVSSDGGSTIEATNRVFTGAGGTTEGTAGDDEFYLGAWTAETAGQIGYGIMRFASNPDSYTFWESFGSGAAISTEREEFSHTTGKTAINHILIGRGGAGNYTGGRMTVIGVKKGSQPVDISGRVENGAVFVTDQELLFQETMGVRYTAGTRGRVRVDPAANANAVFQLTSGDGTVIGTATVLATETEGTFFVPTTVTVTDAVKVLAPTLVDSAIQSAYIAIRGEASV